MVNEFEVACIILEEDNPDVIRVGDGVTEAWLPRDKISIRKLENNLVEITMPNELAKESGFL